jgi:hypothetical protein
MNAARYLFVLTGLCLLAFAVPAAAELYEITIENLIPGGPDTGQPMTPPVGVVHGPGYALFTPGMAASAGLELLAEDGVTDTLVDEADADPDVYDVETGGGPFFDMTSFMVAGDPGDLFSVVTMLARSNDLFTGLAGIALPADMTPLVIEPTEVWDAGSEENTGMIEHIPFYGNAFVGPDEFGVVAAIGAYSVINDPDHGTLVWEFPPSARITVQMMDSTPAASSSWSAVKRLY